MDPVTFNPRISPKTEDDKNKCCTNAIHPKKGLFNLIKNGLQ